jgi:phosphoglycerate dehydrogenase-like enzyme
MRSTAKPEVVVSSPDDLTGGNRWVDMLLAEGFKVRVLGDRRFADGARSDMEEIETLRGASAVLAWGERYPAGVIESLPDLRVIARLGVGIDKVDVGAATDRGVVVTVTPTANREAVAEHALALILATAKSVIAGDRDVRAGRWSRSTQVPLRGRTLGIVGLGRIGRSLASRAQAMRMKVIASEIVPDHGYMDEHGIELVDLDTLLRTADYVSLHCPLTDDTRGMINGDRLAMMKPDAVLVNTARGGIVVEADLVEALRSSTVGGAALDVFEQEPAGPHNPLFQLDNVILSPHVAGSDLLAVEDMGAEAAQCIIDLSRGVWPEDAVVNAELKGRWRW